MPQIAIEREAICVGKITQATCTNVFLFLFQTEDKKTTIYFLFTREKKAGVSLQRTYSQSKVWYQHVTQHHSTKV